MYSGRQRVFKAKQRLTQTIIRKIRRRNTDEGFLFFEVEVTRTFSTVSSLNTQNYWERENINRTWLQCSEITINTC